MEVGGRGQSWWPSGWHRLEQRFSTGGILPLRRHFFLLSQLGGWEALRAPRHAVRVAAQYPTANPTASPQQRISGSEMSVVPRLVKTGLESVWSSLCSSAVDTGTWVEGAKQEVVCRELRQQLELEALPRAPQAKRPRKAPRGVWDPYKPTQCILGHSEQDRSSECPWG